MVSYTYTVSGATTGSGTNISGTQLNVGMNIITWTATDNAIPANTETCIITVNVTDSLFPSLSCVDNQLKDTDTNQCFYTTQGTEFDLFASTVGATLVNDFNNSSTLAGAVFNEGTTLVTWTASQIVDGITYTDTCDFFVVVNDNEPPVVVPPPDITIGTTNQCMAQIPTLGTPTTSDNCGVLRVWNNAIDNDYNLGTQSITWFIEDIHGNISSAMQNITVVDDDPPTFNCTSNITRRVDEGQNFYTVFGDEFEPFRVFDCNSFTTTNDFNNTDSLSGVQFPIGTTVVTWTYTDALGNISTCVMTITITDNTDPSPPVTCRQNQARNTDTNICTYTVQGAEMDVSSTAAGVTFTYTLTGATTGSGGATLDGVILDRGETIVTWTADNGISSNSYCTYSIFVIDNQDPVITWPPDLNLNADFGDCVATGVNLGSPTSTDNCDGPLDIVYTQSTTETTFELGETLVYWTARDIRGNFQFHTQRVTVVDNQAPVITCPTETFYREYTNPGIDFYYVNGNEFTPPVSDNCEVVSYTNNRTGTGFLNGEELSAGSYTFTWTASDGTNTTTCDVNVVVVDALEPEIACSGNATQTADNGSCAFTIPIGDSSYDTTFLSAAGVSRTLTHDMAGAPSNTTLAGANIPVGTTTITWTATQTIGGTLYTSTCSFDFTVEDEEPPVLDTPFDDVTLNVVPGTCNNSTTLTPPTATDNCSAPGDITITSNAPATFSIGLTVVRWVLTDEADNQTTYDQNVTIIDNESPIITNCPSSSITVAAEGSSCQAVVSWPALTATDPCSGMDSFVSNFSPGSLFDIGTTTVTYTATDNNGNVSTCSFDVVVTDTPPTITCITDQSRNVDSGSCAYTVVGNELDPTTVTDNCTAPSLTWSFIDPDTNALVSGINTLSGVTIPRGPENGANTGRITINWSTEDSGGQTSTCSYVLTIIDNEPPNIIVQGNQVRPTDPNQNYYTVQGTEFDDVTASDNCGIVTKIVNEFNVNTLDGQQLALGVNSITWEATDDNGNIGTAIFTVTVVDNEAPRLLNAPTNITVNISSGCSEIVNYTPPTFIDNVTAEGDLAILVTPSVAVPGYDFPLGETDVTYTVTDEAGNTFSYDFTVTVIDDTDPTINCPPGDSGNQFNRNTDSGESFHTTLATEFDPTSFSDNCDVTLSNDFNNNTSLAGETFPIGTTTVIWTATDDSNNTISCSIDIVVTDVELPVINNCPDVTVNQTAETGECYYQVVGSEFDPFSFEDNAGLSRLTYSLNGAAEVGTDLSTTLSGEQIPVGTLANPTTTVLWRLYDTSNNVSATCSTEFTITDTQNPTFVTIATQTRSLDPGFNTYTAKSPSDLSWNIPVTDNCDLQTITYQIDGGAVIGTDLSTSIIGETFGVGTHTVVWEATDVNGNSNTGSYQVIIEDNEDPTVVCNNITIQLDNTGNYTLSNDNINAIALGTSDPSGIASLVVTPNTFECSDVGPNTIVLIATDNNGNTSSCNATVTVQDTTPPTALCQPISVVLDAFGNASITAQDIDNGSTDACGAVTLSVSETNFDCTNLGINTVTLTVTDINGNSSTCDAVVTVLDNITPVAVCQNITVALDATGNASITALDIDNGSFDNCQSSLARSLSQSDFDCTDVGTNMITLTVTDTAGNADSCTAIVTVEDNVPPVAIAQDITINLDNTGNATITPGDIDNGSSDSCGIASLVLDKTDFDCSNLGANPVTNTVTLTVTDVNNNISTATALVIVEDDIAPAITCTTAQTVGTDSDKCGYEHIGASWDATATDGCVTINNLTYALSGATVLADNSANTSLNGQVFNSGITTVTWTAIDGSGVSSQCSFTVTVNDTTAPIANGQNVSIQLDATGNVSITANDVNNGSTDNCGIQTLSIDQTDFTCADFGPNTVTLTVTDTSGNSSTDDVIVTVQDAIDPVANCTPITIELDTSGNYNLSTADINNIAFGSSDNCPNFTASVSPNTFSCAEVGSNTVTLTITDIAGNTNTCSTTVTVEDNTPPIALCQDITIQLDAFGDASILATDIDNGSSDACGINSLVLDENTFGCADLGANTVTLTVTDTNGNESTCTATVTVEDNIAPVFTLCPSNRSVVTDASVCTYTHPDNSLNATVSDNCDSTPSLTYSLSGATTIITGANTTLNGQIFEQGTTTVTWTVIDAEGNSDNCSFSVTVTDTEDPVAICQSITIQLQRNGTASIVPTDIDNGSADNCAISTYEISKDNITYSTSLTYSCVEIGSNTVYLRVTDSSGRTNVCSTNVTVEDTQAPTLDDLADRNVVTDTSVCTYAHADDTWNPTDNCDTSPTITYSLAGATIAITGLNTTLNGQIFNTGTTTVTWSVSDNASPPNTGTVIFDVVVTDDEMPTISCPSNITQDVDNGGDSSVTVSGISAPAYADNCGVTQLTYELSGATTTAPQASGINELSSTVFNVGTTTVTYVAEDAAGNTETCNFLVTINSLPNNTVIVSETSIQTSEDLTTDTFTVVLPFAPSGTVVFNVVSDDLTEGTVSTNTLTFDASNWDTPQTVTVTGVDDDIDDDDIGYNIILTTDQAATDDLSGYENVDPADVAVTNLDNDTAGVTVSTISGNTTEDGGTATFTVVLDTEPVQDVSITLTSNDLTESDTFNPTTLTFTPGDWDSPQTVTVTGKDDDIVDGDIAYTIVTSNTSSIDPKYISLAVNDVAIINEDNDNAGFIVTPTSLTTSETGTTATFTVVLTSEPATDAQDFVVVVNVASNNINEGVVDVSSLTFTTADWDIPQTVTVTGVDDAVVDGSIAYTIVNTIDTSLTTDPNYDPLDPDDVSVNNTDDDTATLSIDNVTETEGNSGTIDYVFTITHSGAEVIGGYGVTFFTSNVEARAPSDYTANGGRIDFTSGTIGETQNITISVNGDTAVEINETFNVVLNSVIAPGKNITIDPAGKTGVGTILNDDSTTLSIADASITEGDSGTSTLTFTVELSGEVEDGLTLDYTTADNTATATNSDYVSSTGTITFEGLTNEQEIIEITINGDEIVELDESFLVNLSNIIPVSAPAIFITFSDDSAVGTITNDDSAIISIAGFSVNEGAGTANFSVSTDASIQNEITLEFATSDISAIAGADYTAIGTTVLTFGGVNLENQTISVPITNDNIIEPTETLNGTINNLITNGQSITLAGNVTDLSAIGEIIDNDTATLSINDVSLNEADGIATFTVTLTGNVQNNFTVDYSTADNTAIAASDYTAITTTTLTFGGANSNTQTFDVTILENTIAEPTETYFINLTNLVTNGQTGISIADNQGEGEILDNDALELSIAGFTITETEATQTANFTVTSNIAAEEDITFTLTTTDATAVDGNDYTAQAAQSYTLSAGDTSIDLPVDILGDLIAEPTETFTGTIAVTNDNAQQVSITTDTATATIIDNDALELSIAGFTITETEATQTTNFTVTSNIAAEEDIVFTLTTADVTAVDGDDYTAQAAQSYTLLAGDTSINLPIDILGDLIAEPTETFTGTIAVTNPNAQQVSITTDTATATINDNDTATLSINDVSVNEADGIATFTITLTGNVQNNFTVDYSSANNTAIAASDYTAITTTTLTFGGANSNTQTFDVTILENTIAEPTETYFINLTNLVTNGQTGISIADNQGEGEILDNDALELSIAGFTITETEATQTANFTVTSNIAAEEDIVFTLTTSDVTAVDGNDYTAQAAQAYTLSAGDTSINLPVDILGDLIAEPTETFTGTIAVTNANAQQVSITTDTATATINDNDALELSIAGFTITETEATQTANFTVTSNIAAEEDIVFTLTTTDVTAVDGNDYTAQAAQSYTLVAGDTSINLPVDILGDLIAEPTETFTGTIAVTNPNAQQVSITTDTATATINDNDALELSIAGFTITETEATQTANFTVTSNIAAEEDIVFTLTTSDVTAVDGNDYTAQAAQAYTLSAGDTSINLPVDILGDLIAEPTETFTGTIAVTNANAQQVSITTDTATATINDNDALELSIAGFTITETEATQTANFTVTSNIAAEEDITFTLTTTDVTAVDGNDYTAQAAQSYTLVAGDTSINLPVDILGDLIAEPTETFTGTIAVTNPNAQQVSITTDTATATINDNDALELSIAGFTITETEATQTANFTVTSNIAAEEDITFTLTTTDATAVDGNDYTGQSAQSYTLVAGDTSIDLPVDILGDLIAEPTETFTGTIAVTNPNAQQVSITTDTATATIIDNDALELSIAGFTVTETEATQTANFIVTSNIAAEEDIVFTLTTTDATAIDGNDYTAQSAQSYTLVAGDTSINLPIDILGDLIAEPTETFTGTIAVTNDNAQQVSITTNTATATINDNDTATLSINDVSVNEADGIATFTVTLTGNVQNNFTVDYSTANNTAIAASDYTAITTTTLTFGGANSNTQTFDVTILENTIAEPTETYFINLTNLITNGQTGISIADNQGEGEILDNDALELSIAGFTVTETEATQTANFIVTSNIAAEEDIVFTLTTADVTAVDGDDYTAQAAQSYTLLAGDTSINLPVDILGDLIAEPTETFTATIAVTNDNAQQVSITTDTATATINDNDALTLTIAGFTITETEATQTDNFTVTSNIPAEEDIVFILTTTDATAIDGDDYTAQTAQSYTLSAGDTSIDLPVDILGDLIAEPTETFTGTIAVTNDNAQQVSITTDTATATIIDNDALELSIAGFTITETEATQTANFIVTSNIAAEEDIVFTLTTTDATAIDGDDYTAQSAQSYTLVAGDTSINLPIDILGDLIAEPTETFTATIAVTNDNAQQVSITTDTATATIIDNDTTTLSINDVSVNEADGIATFTITLTGNVQNNFTVDYSSANNTAIAASDYTAITTTTLTFGGANSNTQTFDVTILENTIAEPTETYFINLTNLVTNGQTGISIADNQGEGEILDNDALTLSIAGFTITETEATQTANFTVTSNIAAEEDIVFTLTTSDVTAVDGNDYTAQAAQAYTLSAGDTSINLPVDILGDLIAEPTETFTGTIAVTNANAQQVSITTDTATATINDNDALELSIAGFTITETEATQTANFTVTSNIAAEEDIVFTLTTTDVTAVDGNDYTAQSAQSYTLSAGDTSINLPVDILGDLIAEPTETFTGTIAVTNANAQQVSITTDTATATINDNDALELSIAGFTITETEATQTANFTVTSNIAAEEDIVFTLTTTDVTAVDGNDYTAQAAQSYTLVAGDTSINLPVDILGDLIAEPTETFTGTIAVTNPNAQQVSITTDTATATINDNDALELSIAGFTITETEATQTANFTVTSNIAAEEDIVFTLTTSDVTAVDGNDYTAQAAQAYTLSAGDTSINLPVDILGDLIAEPTETFTGTIAVTNANAQQVSITTDTATATINDNDALELSIAGFTITETEATQTANFTVTSNIAAEEDIVFTLTTTDVTAVDGNDYTAQAAQSYTLVAGDTSINLPVDILGDLIAEPTETFTGTIAVTNPNAQQVSITTDTATATINDNDALELSIAGFTITETEATQTANFTVTSNIAAEEDITFTLTTTDVTAVDGNDYTAQSAQSYTLSAGNTSIDLPVDILGDLIAEPTETFTGTIAVTNDNAQQVSISTDTATATINDNDALTLT